MNSSLIPVSFIVFFRDVYSDLLETVEEIVAACRDLNMDNFEIILIDDGSKEPNEVNPSIFPNIVLKQVRHESSRGISAAILTGVAQAKYDWLFPVPGHAMYGKDALVNVLELRGHGELILGNRTNLAKTRPLIKKIASRVFRDLYRHFFYYYVGDIHGVFMTRKKEFLKYLDPRAGHGNAIQVISNVIYHGGKVIQTSAPVKEGHRKRMSRKFTDLFPSGFAIYSAIRSLLETRRKIQRRNT